MTTRILLCSLLAALCLPSALAQADNPKLVGMVGRNNAFTISLRDASGALVTHVDPGTYDIQVQDFSEEHNFHLRGPGVDMATDPATTSDVVWTVTLADGKYSFICDVHATQMRGWFAVGNVPSTALTASVGPKQRISLQPKIVEAGPATITVSDRSKTDNFHLSGPGVERRTKIAFRGKATWNVTLQPGRYTYTSDKHKKLRGSFVVTLPS
jgi:plastocyanin